MFVQPIKTKWNWAAQTLKVQLQLILKEYLYCYISFYFLSDQTFKTYYFFQIKLNKMETISVVRKVREEIHREVEKVIDLKLTNLKTTLQTLQT